MHIPLDSLHQILDQWGYLAVFLFVGVESCGIPVPGETMLVTAAVYAGTGHLHIPLVIGAAMAGAILGDNAGYWIGRTGGRALAARYGRYVGLNEARLDRAEAFYVRHGNKTVFLGRYMAILRAWTAFLAGLNRMPWPRFVVYDAAAGISWSLLYGTLAFHLGKNLPLLHRILTGMGVAGFAVGALGVILIVYLFLRARRLEERFEEEASEEVAR